MGNNDEMVQRNLKKIQKIREKLGWLKPKAEHERKSSFAIDVETVDRFEDCFSKEWYQAFLEGRADIRVDDLDFDYDAFVEHAKKVCGYDGC